MTQGIAKEKERINAANCEGVDVHCIDALLREAGRDILMAAFKRQINTIHTKNDGSVVTETDLKCQRFIRKGLAGMCPDIAFLGEEMSPERQRACLEHEGRFWCVDPLDGTSNFITPMPLFASSLALVENGRPVLACIYDPVRDEMFIAIRNRGAWMNGHALRPGSEKELADAVGFIDFKRLGHTLAGRLVSERHYRSQRNIGSCALEWAWLAAGRARFIIHGGEKLWDYAAGCLLAAEAGCTVTDFNGRRPFAVKQLKSSIVAATSIPMHQQLLSLLGS